MIEETAVVLGDFHAPFHDEAAVRVACQIIEEVQPNVLVVNGDLVDFYALSRFNPDPKRRLRLQEEIDAARDILQRLRRVAPNARMVFKQGNHETRLKKWCSANPEVGELSCMRLDSLLDFAGVECEHFEETTRFIWNGWGITHGDCSRKRSGFTAHAFIDKWGISGVNNHCHRLAQVEKRDSQQQVCWIEAGCLCSLRPDYLEIADWQNGFCILNKTSTGVWPETVRIVEGKAWLWGRVYCGERA